jgi:hypothetical protein
VLFRSLPPNLILATSNGNLNFIQNGTRLTASLPATDGMGHFRTFNLTFRPDNPALWNEDSVKIDFYTGKEVEMTCGVACSVLNRSKTLHSIKFAMQMLDIRYSDSITVRSRFDEKTEEETEITGWLVNDELTDAFDPGKLTMELLYHNGTSYVPVSTPVSGLTVDSVAHGDSTRFSVRTRLPYTGNITRLRLVLYKTGAGASNPYLADSAIIDVSSPLFARNDIRTVQRYGWTEIDVLGNDVLPDCLFPSTGAFSLKDSVVLPPKNGTLSVNGTGSASRLVYLNSGTQGLTHNIDSFIYRFRVCHDETGRSEELRATVYIYILEETHGASACYGRPFTASLRERPAGVTFRWYTGLTLADTVRLADGASLAFGAMKGDSVRMVKPYIADAPGALSPWNREGGFPPGRMTVHSASETPEPMRWTGLKNTDWHNPENWVQTVNSDSQTYESPVSWSPSPCTDAEIASGAPNWPELTDSAWCSLVSVQDRAMLKNPHVLNYDSARVELKLKSTERDRFIMWSAPLSGMYSGDYHFKDADGQPQWGDVYMNFFQQDNPDPGSTGVAEKNAFTASFGHPGVSLELGKAFNLKVKGTSRSRDVPWIFPQTDNAYTTGGTTWMLTHGKRLISAVPLDADSTFTLTLPANNGFNLVQAVNPYLAWLDVTMFLAGNSSLSPGYLIWNGSFETGFDAIAVNGNRYTWSTSPTVATTAPNLIPPLQSFFVQKKSDTQLASVRMSPNWTTTKPGYPSYVLRAAAVDNGALRIHLAQGQRNSYALLRYDGLAVAEYSGSEDIRTLFYDELPLTLYSFTPLREPLAINASGAFGMQETALGMRLPDAGAAKLAFAGLETFGHNVYLIDRARNNHRTDLQQTPEYAFTVTGTPGSSGVIEVNDRFVLWMEYTGRGLADVSVPEAPEIRCYGLKGHMRVHAVSGTIRRMEVYSMSGALVYAAEDGATEYSIPAQTGVYIVMVQTGAGTVVTEKVIVR